MSVGFLIQKQSLSIHRCTKHSFDIFGLKRRREGMANVCVFLKKNSNISFVQEVSHNKQWLINTMYIIVSLI